MVDAKARQDCIKEIELLQSLDHPNIIRYLASFVDNNEVGSTLFTLTSVFTTRIPVVYRAGVSRSWRFVTNDKAFQETKAANTRENDMVRLKPTIKL